MVWKFVRRKDIELPCEKCRSLATFTSQMSSSIALVLLFLKEMRKSCAIFQKLHLIFFFAFKSSLSSLLTLVEYLWSTITCIDNSITEIVLYFLDIHLYLYVTYLRLYLCSMMVSVAGTVTVMCGCCLLWWLWLLVWWSCNLLLLL